jgi:3',5'-cyclic AMP phosphodiesterase CpdA
MRIALVSDSHLAPVADAFNANWLAARGYVAGAAIDLTIHLGDITLDGFSDAGHHDHARQLTSDWPTSLRFLPGNHDIGDHRPAPDVAAEQPLDVDLLDRYRAAFGHDYWQIDADAWSLIGINAQLLGTDTQAEREQWDWLATAIDAARSRPLALLLHKPLFWEDPADDRPHSRYVPVAPRQRLLKLFAAGDLRLVLSGHTHQYLDRVMSGVRHVWLPSTGYIFPDTLQERLGEKVTGLGLLEVSADTYRLELVSPADMRPHDASDHPEVHAGMKAGRPTRS